MCCTHRVLRKNCMFSDKFCSFATPPSPALGLLLVVKKFANQKEWIALCKLCANFADVLQRSLSEGWVRSLYLKCWRNGGMSFELLEALEGVEVGVGVVKADNEADGNEVVLEGDS